MRGRVISGISTSFPALSRSQGQVTHVLLTRSPLINPASWASSFDLHVLSTPPAFVLSQDQTLRKKQQTIRKTIQHHTNHPKRQPACLPKQTNNPTHPPRSEEHTSELQSLMRNQYAISFLTKTTQ